jgi:hypothetical protein
MSAAQNANDALFLVAEKVQHLRTRALKHKEGDVAAKALAHEIAMTLISFHYLHLTSGSIWHDLQALAFAQFDTTMTSLLPSLLSCVAEIWDKSGPNGKLKGLPDWSTVSDDNDHIRGHPLFLKMVEYQCLLSPAPAPAASQPASTILTTGPLTLTPAPPSPSTPPAPKHDLFIAGKVKSGKCKVPPPETEDKPTVLQ